MFRFDALATWDDWCWWEGSCDIGRVMWRDCWGSPISANPAEVPSWGPQILCGDPRSKQRSQWYPYRGPQREHCSLICDNEIHTMCSMFSFRSWLSSYNEATTPGMAFAQIFICMVISDIWNLWWKKRSDNSLPKKMPGYAPLRLRKWFGTYENAVALDVAVSDPAVSRTEGRLQQVPLHRNKKREEITHTCLPGVFSVISVTKNKP